MTGILSVYGRKNQRKDKYNYLKRGIRLFISLNFMEKWTLFFN